jgi:hypothetical protein
MAHRITIMLDEDVFKKLRTIQSKRIAQSTASYSFSRAVNDALRGNL